MNFKTKKRYANLDHIKNKKTFPDIVKWTRSRLNRRGKREHLASRMRHVGRVEKLFLHTNRTETTISWIGHSTFLIQMAGINIVTDPVWANFMGLQQRFTQPGIEISDMPDVDIVLISHGHYDHLHFPSLQQLTGNPLFLVPVGLQPLFQKKGIERVEQFNWWDQHTMGDVELVFVPAQHWTKRTLWDRNTSHWGGWIIRKPMSGPDAYSAIYFAGDSGYFRGFEEIGKRFNIDYALLPIGAYQPEWFNYLDHISPEQAVKAFLDLDAKTFIPMHYGAFKLADDTPKEALDRLVSEWRRLSLPQANLKLLRLGETLHCEKMKR
ncbi:MBL fold metallo-hydrolase [Paenibacillus aestuarii]|uniref:MBL fold metallo-hydrolase n=1 Tax=Paenibacillus aestuarii TaxID=516965 RepID=A0ABW0K8M4_9BACL|nr:MBL fold metallo-hydrolase [Paenibacillus aestuarii]